MTVSQFAKGKLTYCRWKSSSVINISEWPLDSNKISVIGIRVAYLWYTMLILIYIIYNDWSYYQDTLCFRDKLWCLYLWRNFRTISYRWFIEYISGNLSSDKRFYHLVKRCWSDVTFLDFKDQEHQESLQDIFLGRIVKYTVICCCYIIWRKCVNFTFVLISCLMLLYNLCYV